MVSNLSFFNGCFDKGRLKSLISWSVINCGEQFTIELVENLKNVGFEYATQAGVSLSLDDLKIPPTKAQLVSEAELQIISAQIEYKRGHLTAVEKFQQLIDTWHRTSETLKQNVIQYFRATDILNPVYMMAFSGARGNVSQVRQLVGMRGLMADPQGQIIDFPIRSNFREGLTLTEYVISCYGARKGLVDTALRTANSGYLTRRLVDVSQHVIVCKFDCGTPRGILLSDMTEGPKVLLSLQNRLVGRVLAEDIYTNLNTPNDTILVKQSTISLNQNYNTNKNSKLSFPNKKIPLIKNLTFPKLVDVTVPQTNLIARKDQEISSILAEKIAKLRIQVLVRSPLTCEAKSSICQLCYGWSLAHGNLVSLGEAVGILAAQSIGEPGTQLTMRTFHTGGVFSGDLMTEIRAPFNGVIEFTEFLQGVLIRTPHGKIAFLTKIQGEFYITLSKKPQQAKNANYTPNAFLGTSLVTPKASLIALKEQSEKTSFDSLGDKDSKSNFSIHGVNLVKNEGSILKHKFKIPASTILFARQGEFVLEKQLIAEFSSISTQTNQRIQEKRNLNSELEGQIFFENVLLGVTVDKKNEITRIAKKLGSIWILSGRIYQTMVPTSFFPKTGDLIDSSSVINQILVVSPYTGFLAKNHKKKLFSLLKPTFASATSEKIVSTIFKNPLLSTKSNITKPNEDQIANIKSRSNLTLPLSPWPLKGAKAKAFVSNLKKMQTFPVVIKRNFITLSLRDKGFSNQTKFDNLALKKQGRSKRKVLQKSGNLAFGKHLSLSCTLLSFSVKAISYYKLGYFVTLWSNKQVSFDLTKSLCQKAESSFNYHILGAAPGVRQESKLSDWNQFYIKDNWKFQQNLANSEVSNFKPDLFFLSTSLKQEVTDSAFAPAKGITLKEQGYQTSFSSQGGNLKKLLYIQSFPKNYKTQTGGLLFYDSLYFDDNGGQISWISEERYQLDPKTFFIPTKTGFTFFSLFKLNEINLKNFCQKYSKKWVNNNLPLLSKYNSQGKISNFSSKMSGWVQIKLNNNSNSYNKKPNTPLKVKTFSVQIQKKLVSKPASQKLITSSPKCVFWEIHRLKTLFSNQFLTFENIAILPIKIISFRKNPYILVNQRNLKTYKRIPYKKNYSNELRKFEKKFQFNFFLRNWFLEFKKYKCNKAFLNKEKSTSLTSKTPFINSPFSFINKKSILTKFEIYDSNKLFNEPISQVNLDHKFLGKNQVAKQAPFVQSSCFNNNNTNSFEIGIKSGWVYFPRNTTHFSNYHKSILRPGFAFTDNIEFDQQTTYIECISIPFFLVDNWTSYFNPFQVKEKNVSLKLQLNCQNLIKDFPISFLKTSNRFYFSQKNKKQVCYKKQNYKNLNSFLVKLEKSFSLNKNIFNNKRIDLYTFNREEIDLVRQGIPNWIKLGSDITLFCDKIYYIKNRNHRYYDLPQNKNLNLTHSFFRRKLNKKITVEKPDLPNKLSLSLGNQTKFHTYSDFQIEKNILVKKNSSFYLSKSYLKFKNVNLLKNRLINQIAPLNINSFAFDNFLPNKLVNKPLSSSWLLAGESAELNKVNSHFFTPSFFILIRKVKQYSSFKSKHYKKILSQNNQLGIVSNTLNYRRVLTNLTWFNKQVQTKLFSSFPSGDLQINSSFRFKNSKQIFVTKELNIFEFFILLNIPKLFPFKIAKVGFTSKQTFFTDNSLDYPHLTSKDKLSSNYKNQFLRYLEIFSRTNRLEFTLSRKIDNSSFIVPALKSKVTQFTNTKVILHSPNYILANNPLSLTDFFSPYQGEIMDIKVDSLGKKSCFFLTEKDQLSFATEKSKPLRFVGTLIRYGEQIAENLSIPHSGQIIQVDKSKVILRKAQPILFSSKGVLYVRHGDFIEKNSPLLTFFYQRLKTGDIVQGIPQIEQLFEARQTQEGEVLPENVHAKLHDFFSKYKQKYSPQDAARKSLEQIQQLLVDEVQRVYQSQGVTIADKHLEIIVRQMTSKVKIIEGGKSGLLRGELIALDWIESVNKSINSQKAEYEPVILGITKAALETESFISAASFQETTRILARAAIERKTDFLRGLKENVILGHLIPAGTGFSLSFNPQSLDYSTEIEKVKVFRKIYLGLTKK
uniref:DNA-directed RNA polymerase subunit beta'' n=1 Tax=Koliella longiseta TaxID=33092 RepID=A0A097KLH6_9CHLO|nr:beta'' subunit of RNA polymerase [Koliella longiseta]AIT94018.1 beta'' subunit of RNA polymerase [Koliella longiseta]